MKQFMGYPVYVDDFAQQYVIEGPNKKTVRVDKHLMESDDDYMSEISGVVNAWNSTANALNIRQQYHEYAQKRKADLRDVSTRDLLNEAFRRGAIKQMSAKRSASTEMATDANYIKHVNTSIRQDALAGAVDELEKYGVFNVGKTENPPHQPGGVVEYSVDYFICKHPLTIQKEEGYAD